MVDRGEIVTRCDTKPTAVALSSRSESPLVWLHLLRANRPADRATRSPPASVDVRWRIRKRTVAHVFSVEVERQPVTAVMFRSTGPELEVLRGIGPPYFSEWKDAVMMTLDDRTDWTEVAELLTESYRFLAPKKLIAKLELPEVNRLD